MITQACDPLLPGEQHPFSYVPETGVFRHLFANHRYSLSHRVADRFQDERLLSGWNAEGAGHKLHEVLARCPCLFAKKSNSRRIVLVTRVDTRREEIVSRRKMSVGTRAIEQSNVLCMTIGITQSIGEQQDCSQLPECLVLPATRYVIPHSTRNSFPGRLILGRWTKTQQGTEILHAPQKLAFRIYVEAIHHQGIAITRYLRSGTGKNLSQNLHTKMFIARGKRQPP